MDSFAYRKIGCMLARIKHGLARRRVAGVNAVLLGRILAICGCFFALAEPISEKPTDGYVDMHVHAAGLGYGNSGAFVGTELTQSWKFRFYLSAFDVNEKELAALGDTLLLQRLSDKIEKSQFVEKAVVLAMDGVVDDQGELNRSRTQFYVPNEYLIRELPKYENLLFGASVNPLRRDSLERLNHAAENGAALMKWIPNIMHIDPGDTRIEPFYRRMAELCLPLLTHTGAEKSFGAADDSLGDPLRLRLPLALGVTVIAAHIATTGKSDGEEHFDRFVRMFDRYPNLYADVSSLTQINKRGYFKRVLAVDGLMDRLVYGSDWPLQFFPLVSPFYQLGTIRLRDVFAVRRFKNIWDRDVVMKKYAGIPEHVFQRFPTLLQDSCSSAQ